MKKWILGASCAAMIAACGVVTTGEAETNKTGKTSSAPVADLSVTDSSATDVTDATVGATSFARDNAWYTDGEAKLSGADAALRQSLAGSGKAKNVILFVGDGMGVATVSAARILDGQNKGGSGEENILSFETMPFTGLSKTYNVDAQTPDSAGTATALMSGVKTDIGVVGVDESIINGECKGTDAATVISALELAEIAGMATGVVSTARITHATPASTYAHSASRGWEDTSDMPNKAKAEGCVDIASQLTGFEAALEARYPGVDVDGIEVAMGGGRRHFLPKDASFNTKDADGKVEGDRDDDRDLTAEWQAAYTGGQYVIDQAGFDALDVNGGPILGLFSESHMRYEANRGEDELGEPSLAQMTSKAIEKLSTNDKGFFLMVEAGRIDHAHHAGNAAGALNDTVALSEAVDAALSSVNLDETLIIVTADHSHVMTFAGYPKRGNPILGKVVGVGEDEPTKAADGYPYTTLGYMNGGGYVDMGKNTDSDKAYYTTREPGRKDLTDIDTTAPGYHQEALVPRSSETHGGEDVPIYAIGPGSHLASGVHEQNVIFHIMNRSARLTEKAEDARGE
ncbi:MAG: alkaline phosphatase [Maricaulaceae bacterium]